MLTGLRSRKHIAPFDLVQPGSIEECCAHLARPGRAALMAGGVDLIDRMKSGETFDRVVSLSRIAGLSDIRIEGDTIVIGALATHAMIAQSALIAEHFPDLSQFWAQIANPRIRYAGTIGGNLMSAQPHYDAMPALLALNATVTMADMLGRHQVALSDLANRKALLADVRVPFESRRLLAERSLHPAVAVYAGARIKGDLLSDLRIAIGGAYAQACVFALPVQETSPAFIVGDAAKLAQDMVAGLPEPLDDGLASASYRRRMIEVLTRRLLVRLGNRA